MTYRYSIELTAAAARVLRGLPKETRRRIGKKIGGLEENPRPPGAKKLEGEGGVYRIRAGDYRILYVIRDAQLLVLVIDVGHRRDVYR